MSHQAAHHMPRCVVNRLYPDSYPHCIRMQTHTHLRVLYASTTWTTVKSGKEVIDTHTHIYMYIYKYIYIYIYINVHPVGSTGHSRSNILPTNRALRTYNMNSAPLFIHLLIHSSIHVYIYIYIHESIYIYMCVYIHTKHTCIYMYNTYIYTLY